MQHSWKDTDKGNPSHCHFASTHSTRTYPGLNLVLPDETPATTCPSHGMTKIRPNPPPSIQIIIITTTIIIIIIIIMEPEMYDHTSNNWSHWNSNTELKEKSASYTRNTFNRLYKRRLYLEHHTYYEKHYSVKLET